MRIKYEFCTEDVEIEVSGYWAAVLRDLDRIEYNINQKETRRHCSLYTSDPRYSRIYMDASFEDKMIEWLEAKRLWDAISLLPSRQQYLIEQVYLLQRSYTEIGNEIGVHRTTVMRKTKEALSDLKKIVGELHV